MPKAVIMPRFGMTQEDATIVRWIAGEGQRVESGDPICEVTTDKINMEVEATATGILYDIRFAEGAVVPVTEVIAYIRSDQEAPAPDHDRAAKPALAEPGTIPTQESAAGQAAATPVARRMAAAIGVDLASVEGSGPQGRVTSRDIRSYLEAQSGAPAGKILASKARATPAARRLAAEHSIDLGGMSGSGFEGRVQGSDVRAALAALSRQEQSAPAMGDNETATGVRKAAEGQPGQVQAIPLSGMRRTIAQRMQASYQQAPHIMLTMEIDMGKASRMRDRFNARLADGGAPVSMTAVIVKACAAALAEHPLLNSLLVDETIYMQSQANIGVAVALEEGLIVPVVQQAGEKGLFQIAQEIAELSQRARQGRLRPPDVEGGTFTVSNLGMFGIDHFTAILNPPQVAILAVGRIARRFVPGDGDQPVARSLMAVTLSVDHRAVDGAAGARFLATLRDILETAGSQWG